MCILCGELVSSFHWSDVDFKEQKKLISVGENAKERKRARGSKGREFLTKFCAFMGCKLLIGKAVNLC